MHILSSVFFRHVPTVGRGATLICICALLEVSVSLVTLRGEWPCIFLFAICACIAIGMFVAEFTKIKAFARPTEAVLGITLCVIAARASIIETHSD